MARGASITAFAARDLIDALGGMDTVAQVLIKGPFSLLVPSAEAAGVGQVLLAPGTVDVYNPKVVRGAMGTQFRLPVARLAGPASGIGR